MPPKGKTTSIAAAARERAHAVPDAIKEEELDAQVASVDADTDEYSDEGDSDASEADVAAPKGTKPFEPHDSMQKPHYQKFHIEVLVKCIDDGYMDLNPDYQRDVVWPVDKMVKLINSIMGNIYVPPLIFNVHEDTVNGKLVFRRRSIDGKQRLTSIYEFVKGRIPCLDTHNRRWFFVDDGAPLGKTKHIRKRVLSEKQRQKFVNTEILCVEYNALEIQEEEDLFARVQLGVPLSPAEKLKATSGPWQSLANEILTTYDTLFSIIDNRRGRGFQLTLQILRQLTLSHEDAPNYNAGANALKGFCSHASLCTPATKVAAHRVFRIYTDIALQFPATFQNNNYRHSARFSPIEFVGAAVLLLRFPDRNSRLLSGDILHMRQWLRERRQDLRSNGATWNCLVDFVENIELHRGGAGVVRNADFGAPAAGVAPVAVASKKDTTPASMKKRQSGSEDAAAGKEPPRKVPRTRTRPSRTIGSGAEGAGGGRIKREPEE